ncbi:hypothetical protein KO525_03025 [Psychrosphaera sp. B3R10]|uniref:Uncharacterized protein n=1 Tax=Psychrosphaera algicola TaxID=3023714 RepID=A0ABT5F9B9_9GAMM|nr:MULTISPECIES: hypothetical protein [unclassified Psychrosphaera]MBU2881247.1 hypothetical protein [Psychrosphaera sp. I2R16]MBU2988346.1 hypothetical protein [Psychrosphaera sp. B3R10]MDC2888128.1 hypothetical protein [Psychrosphaera sp. G1-22]MDO6720157.1 hypothetical protein [Psychrosphaera sp. 1_MG-2023]
MKKLTACLLAASLAFGAQAADSQSLKLISVSSYLNFFLVNLNGCEDYHPSVRAAAYQSESKLYPHYEKLDKKISSLKIDKSDKDAISNTIERSRAKLNAQIAEGEFSVEHCKAVIGIVENGLDSNLLSALN